MTLSRVQLEHFTAFDQLDLDISAGVNVLVGANATGKTHLMKVLYAACDVSKTQNDIADKLVNVFLPSQRRLGRLVRRQQGSSHSHISVYREGLFEPLTVRFSNHAKRAKDAEVSGLESWQAGALESVYIPVKEMLANAPGFRSLYAQRDIHFEEIYADILDRAYRPMLRGPLTQARQDLLTILQRHMAGSVVQENEEFFLRSKQGKLEFSLLAEGLRKLGLLWLLIQNGTLQPGSVLFWDEPETNLNPTLFGMVVDILLALQRSGVQVFLASHDYVVLKELDLRKQAADQLRFYAFDKDDTGRVTCHVTSDFASIHPNAIMDAFSDVYDREVARSLADMVG